MVEHYPKKSRFTVFFYFLFFSQKSTIAILIDIWRENSDEINVCILSINKWDIFKSFWYTMSHLRIEHQRKNELSLLALLKSIFWWDDALLRFTSKRGTKWAIFRLIAICLSHIVQGQPKSSAFIQKLSESSLKNCPN